MFAFRNHSSPTVSQLLHFSRSPVTITILGAAPAASGTRPDTAGAGLAIDLLHGVIAQLERSEPRVLDDSRRRAPYSANRPGAVGQAGAFALGVATALLAARLFATPRRSAPALARDQAGNQAGN